MNDIIKVFEEHINSEQFKELQRVFYEAVLAISVSVVEAANEIEKNIQKNKNVEALKNEEI